MIYQGQKILVIDDDQFSALLIKKYLASDFKVLLCENPQNGVKAAQGEFPDLILLGLNLPGLDGLAACHLLRTSELTRDIPVIVLSSCDDIESRIKAFNQGADDVITKPLLANDLRARVNSKIRRFNEVKNPLEQLACGNLTIDIKRHEVRLDGTAVDLSAIEFSLLRCLVQNNDRVLTREQILKNVWRSCSVTPRTIDTHILSLRKKLYRSNFQIDSIYGVGYILNERKTVHEMPATALSR